MKHEIQPLIPVPKLSDEDMKRIYKKLMEEKPKLIPNVQNGFYRIDLQEILSNTTQEYRTFLRDAGYGDLDACPYISIAKKVLRIDQNVRDAAARNGITLTENDNDYVTNINQIDARKLVESMGYKLLTTGLMYKLFIPYIKNLEQQGNAEAKETLDDMYNNGEWLEDIILDKYTVRIGTKGKLMRLLPNIDGWIDRININSFSYPALVKNKGEFYYFSPKNDQIGAVRRGSWELALDFSYNFNISTVEFNMRLAKLEP